MNCPCTEISFVINNSNNKNNEVPQNRMMTGEKRSSFWALGAYLILCISVLLFVSRSVNFVRFFFNSYIVQIVSVSLAWILA